jgi:hypothetical protein
MRSAAGIPPCPSVQPPCPLCKKRITQSAQSAQRTTERHRVMNGANSATPRFVRSGKETAQCCFVAGGSGKETTLCCFVAGGSGKETTLCCSVAGSSGEETTLCCFVAGGSGKETTLCCFVAGGSGKETALCSFVAGSSGEETAQCSSVSPCSPPPVASLHWGLFIFDPPGRARGGGGVCSNPYTKASG